MKLNKRESNEALLCRRLVDAVNRRSGETLEALFHEGYVDVDLTRSRICRDSTHFLGTAAAVLKAFPDARLTASIAYTRQSRIGIYWLVSATQSASLMGVPPTNRKVRLRGFTTLRIRDGLISHGLHLWDMAGLLRDLRLVADLTEVPESFDPESILADLLDEKD